MNKQRTEFYEFTQNNSGGHFDVDDKLCHRLFIEAKDQQQAVEIATNMGVYFDGCDAGMDCDCCGDRWYEPDSIDLERLSSSYNIKFDSVESYAQHLADLYGWTTPDARVFYLDGKVNEIFKKQDP